MAQREFDITIEPNGLVEVHIKGFKGRTCNDVVKLFQKIIGEIQSQQQTSEFYEPDEVVRFKIDLKN